MGEMTKVFDNRLKYVGIDLAIWDMAEIFLKWLRYMGNDLSI